MIHFVRLLFICSLAGAFTARAAEPDPKILGYTLPENIQWKDNPARTNQTAILYGDPTKPGPYAMLIKWKAGNMSRPHYHEHDRFFVVVSGTWWVGTGPKFDPEGTKPMRALYSSTQQLVAVMASSLQISAVSIPITSRIMKTLAVFFGRPSRQRSRVWKNLRWESAASGSPHSAGMLA